MATYPSSDQVAFTISEVSKIIAVPSATIRHWEKAELISPQRLDNGYRSYSFSDIEQLKEIKKYAEQKMGIKAIKHLLAKEEEGRKVHDVPQISKKMLGQKWRESRQKKGLSIEEVAKATDISPSYLSKVENAQANVSYEILQKIAAFYGENVLYYYVSQNHTPRLVRKGSGEKFAIDIPGVILETIATGNLSVVKYTILPHSGRHEPQAHNGSELVYILKGSIDYTLDEKDFFTLNEGDAFHFNSAVNHRWFNNSETETELLWMYIAETEKSLES